MKDAVEMSAHTAVHPQAVADCEAIHFSKPEVFVEMCHEAFPMSEVGEGVMTRNWDKVAYLDRVAGRDAFPREPSYEIFSIDDAGGDMARVHLWVDMPPKRNEDHLGFVKSMGLGSS